MRPSRGNVARPIETLIAMPCSAQLEPGPPTAWTAALTRSATATAAVASVPGEDQRELVAAVAEDVVALAARGHDRAGDVGQQPVAGLVAEGVVDGLEVVEVEHDQAERLARLDAPLEPALERPVVEEPGQVVGLGADLDGAVDLGVLEGDRDLGGEELDELELVLRVARVVAEPLEGQDAGRSVAATKRDADQAAFQRTRRGTG